MAMRTVLGVTIVAAALAASCGNDDEAISTTDSSPVTLGELDGVVLTVAPDDLRGDTIRIEDLDGDGEADIIEITEDDEFDAGAPTTLPPATTVDPAAVDEPAAAGDDGLNPLGGDDPEDKRMPDVVCMGLQDAQDEIQDRGVFFSKSVDATGEGRRQLWDRNWIVVAQDPAPGESIGENEAVLSVVKTDEDHDC